VSNTGVTRPRREVILLLALAVVERLQAQGQIPSAPASAQTRPGYRLEPYSPDRHKALAERELGILEKLNRRDRDHLVRLTEVVVPDAFVDDELAYSPLPTEWAWASGQAKALVVDQPMQVFGAYEHGRLVHWGPVSSGRQETATPSGFFHLTWKAKSRRSTDNEAWLLNWYFNFINSRGVSFHEFELPGRPASHACVRLLRRDAEWLYAWGEQWRLTPDGRQVQQTGTPVAVVGQYDFTKPPPWTSLEAWRGPISLPADPTRP
jgi:hypothetical protein